MLAILKGLYKRVYYHESQLDSRPIPLDGIGIFLEVTQFLVAKRPLTLHFTNMHSVRLRGFIRDDQIKGALTFLLIR